jgi:hypothetical protein
VRVLRRRRGSNGELCWVRRSRAVRVLRRRSSVNSEPCWVLLRAVCGLRRFEAPTESLIGWRPCLGAQLGATRAGEARAKTH